MKHKMKEVPLKAPDEKIMDLSVAPWGYTVAEIWSVPYWHGQNDVRTGLYI